MEIFTVRKKPLFEFILNEDSFEIHNTDFTWNNGVYLFSDLESLSLNESETDWFPTILVKIIPLLFGRGGMRGVEETDNRFLFRFKSGRKMEVKLINCNIETANIVFTKIQQKLSV